MNPDMQLEDQNTYEAIAASIHSDQSPVGIDAKKTHIIIIQKLIALEERMKRLEAKLDEKDA
jgi:hypothetical protein